MNVRYSEVLVKNYHILLKGIGNISRDLILITGNFNMGCSFSGGTGPFVTLLYTNNRHSSFHLSIFRQYGNSHKCRELEVNDSRHSCKPSKDTVLKVTGRGD